MIDFFMLAALGILNTGISLLLSVTGEAAVSILAEREKYEMLCFEIAAHFGAGCRSPARFTEFILFTGQLRLPSSGR